MNRVFVKNNFLSDFNTRAIAKMIKDADLLGKVYVDALESSSLMEKEFIDRTAWIAPIPISYNKQADLINEFLSEKNECGFIVDVRVRSGKTIPKRTRQNCYVFVEYAHENSIPRSLKIASQKKAVFAGVSARVYKSGTRTAIIWPKAGRKK